MGDIGDRDLRGSQVTPRATGVAAVVSVALGLAAGAAAWALSRAAHSNRSPVADGMFCAFTVGALCFVFWQRRVEASRAKYRWRELKSSDPLYGTWRDLRERSRLLTWTLAAAVAVGALVAWLVSRVQIEVLSMDTDTSVASYQLYKARCAAGAAKWKELGLPDTRTNGLEHFESVTRDLGCARLAISTAFVGLLILVGLRLLAWPCPRCAAPFLRHRRPWYLWAALVTPVAIALMGLFFGIRGSSWRGYGWLVLMVLPNLVNSAFFSFMGGYAAAASFHKFKDNYARRHGDPEWKRKVTPQCVHCGLDVWAPAVPTSSAD
jgi:hypothetical protein